MPTVYYNGMNKKRRKAKLMPRKGPPENIRPAGAHEPKKRYNRRRDKAERERLAQAEAEDG